MSTSEALRVIERDPRFLAATMLMNGLNIGGALLQASSGNFGLAAVLLLIGIGGAFLWWPRGGKL